MLRKNRIPILVLLAIAVSVLVIYRFDHPSWQQPHQRQFLAANHPSFADANDQPRWRRLNRHIVDYRPESDVSERVDRLVSKNAPPDHPEVVRLARDIIDPVPKEAAAGLPMKLISPHHVWKTPQAEHIDDITRQMRGGFFVECGAYDGEEASNTIWLEKYRGWTGLLVEMDPKFYAQLIGKNRRVWSANVCLSPLPQITTLTYSPSDGQLGRLLYDSYGSTNSPSPPNNTFAEQVPAAGGLNLPCFPLESLLLAINRTRVDYLSLDVEGLELEVLESMRWDRIDIRAMSVEYSHVKRGKGALIEYMDSREYQLVAHLRVAQPDRRTYVDDFIFTA